MKRLLASIAATGLLSLTLVGPTLATKPSPDHKVQLCHRTASDSNPYVLIEINEAAVDTHLNNGQGHPAKTNEDGSPRNDFLYVKGEAECEPGEEEPTPTPEVTPTPTPEVTPTPTPEVTPTPTPEVTPTPTPTPTPEVTPTPTPTSPPTTSPAETAPPTDTVVVGATTSSNDTGLGLALFGLFSLVTGLLVLLPRRKQA